jgi:hypothetical protein
METTHGDLAIWWISRYCDDRGRPVGLTPEQRATLRRILDDGDTTTSVTGDLAGWLAAFRAHGPSSRAA